MLLLILIVLVVGLNMSPWWIVLGVGMFVLEIFWATIVALVKNR